MLRLPGAWFRLNKPEAGGREQHTVEKASHSSRPLNGIVENGCYSQILVATVFEHNGADAHKMSNVADVRLSSDTTCGEDQPQNRGHDKTAETGKGWRV